MSEYETRDLSPDSDDPNSLESILNETPDQIGSYKILGKLGEGGFGIVYEALQEKPVKRRVALKVIKPGMDSNKVIARFEAERQALALMTHPNIAKVLGGGLTDRGLPYFVMELVKGEPITDFCDRNKMTLDDRLKLLIPVCNAVQHAHAKAVIHRDLKPSNILVGYNAEGEVTPTVIDFGVAKALNEQLSDHSLHTAEGQLVGTPEYMSPEQAGTSGLDIDTRTDVYSLGAVLYQLLTGFLPFESGELRSKIYTDMQRYILEQTPPKPSTRFQSAMGSDENRKSAIRFAKNRKMGEIDLPKHLKGELDWVVMKCLEKDRDRRYATPLALAEELQHYLNNEPVTARPPSASYRFSKLVKRNKAPVAAILFFVVVLIAATIVSVRFSVVAEQERQLALDALEGRDAALESERERANELQRVTDFQSDQLSSLDPQHIGQYLRDGLHTKIKKLHTRLGSDPQVISDALDQYDQMASGVDFTGLALDTLNEHIFNPTRDEINDQFQGQPIVRATLLQSLADTMHHAGLLDHAIIPQSQALKLRREHLGNEHPDTLKSINNMGTIVDSKGDSAKALIYHTEALEIRRRVLGDDHIDTLTSMNNLGFAYESLGKFNKAMVLYQEALGRSRKTLGDDHHDTIVSINNMASLLYDQGKLEEAEPYYIEALERRIRLFGEDHSSTLTSINNMGFFLDNQGKYDEALVYYTKSLNGSRTVLGSNHPDTLTSINNMGNILQSLDRYKESERYYQEALDARKRVLGEDHILTLLTTSNMGYLQDLMGNHEQAEEYHLQAQRARLKTLGPNHPDTITSNNNLGFHYQDQGNFGLSHQYFLSALDGLTASLGAHHPSTLSAINNIAYAYELQEQYDQSDSYYKQAIQGRRQILGDTHEQTLFVMYDYADMLYNINRFNDAQPLAYECYQTNQRINGNNHRETKNSLGLLIDIHTDWHEADPNAGHDTKAGEYQTILDEINAESSSEPESDSPAP